MDGQAATDSLDPCVVGLVQIAEPMLDHTPFPYAVAMLQSYVKAHAPRPQRYLFLLPVFERLPLPELVSGFSLAQVVGFSTYCWNMQYSLAAARALKTARPEVLIVFGGPQVPDDPTAFMTAHPFVDLCVHGPGEEVFLQILEALPRRDWADLPGLSRRGQSGEVVTTQRARPPRELDHLPSPYLDGSLDLLMRAHPRQRWVGVWETNRGCPFTCTFCDWGSATAAKLSRFGMERVLAELDWFGTRQIPMVFCSDSNFGMLPRDDEIADALVAVHQRTGFPRRVITSTAKNITERAYAVQKKLLDAGLNGIASLALQSVNPDVLKAIRRDNISLETYQELQHRFRRDGVPTFTDILVGLPGDTYDSFIANVGTVIAQGQHREMRLWNTWILPNSELAHPDYRRRYGIQTVTVPQVPMLQPVDARRDEIVEYQELLIETATMPREDWVRMRVFSWLVQILYYSQALQVPIMLLHALRGVPYEAVFRAFAEGPLPPQALVLEQLRRFLFTKARETAQGAIEYVPGIEPETGQLTWMPPDYFSVVHLVNSPRLDGFFAESHQLLAQLAGEPLPAGLLEDAVALGRAWFRSVRPDAASFQLSVRYNLWEFYQQVITGAPIELRQEHHLLIHRPEMGDQLESQRVGFASRTL